MAIPEERLVLDPVDHLTTNPYIRYMDFKLNHALSIPSAVHGYSLAVEYMKNWFLKKFDDGFFKTEFINGKHIMDDYMRYSKVSKIKKAKPALAITPIPNREYDRNLLDSYMGGSDMILRNFNFQQSFFKDYDNNIFLGFAVKEIELAFNFKVRLSTRSQQEDIYEMMKLRFRIGYTQYDYIATDFHIPYEMILNIAYHSGFEVTNNNHIKDPIEFLSYLNSHSEFPIIYKLRTISGNNEFFMRVPNTYVWIDTQNPLDADDGEKEGQLYTNYHIDLNCTMRMRVPHFYVYNSAKKIIGDIPTTNSSGIGIYNIALFEFPDINSMGWTKEISSSWIEDEISEDPITIDMTSLLDHDVYRKVIDLSIKSGISPYVFIDIMAANSGKVIEGTMDWNTNHFTLSEPTKSYETLIAIYINKQYINEQLAVIDQIMTSRLR